MAKAKIKLDIANIGADIAITRVEIVMPISKKRGHEFAFSSVIIVL
jgi:hypothetical protein